MTLLLDIMLGLSVVNSLVGVRIDVDTQESLVAKYGLGVVALRLFTTLSWVVLYVVFGVLTGYWQFAASVLISLLVTSAGAVGRHAK